MIKSILAATSVALFVFAQTLSAAPPERPYEHCAAYGETCGKGGKSRMVRFGFAGNWAEKEIKGAVVCLPENFDSPDTVSGLPFADENSGGLPAADKSCEEQ